MVEIDDLKLEEIDNLSDTDSRLSALRSDLIWVSEVKMHNWDKCKMDVSQIADQIENDLYDNLQNTVIKGLKIIEKRWWNK